MPPRFDEEGLGDPIPAPSENSRSRTRTPSGPRIEAGRIGSRERRPAVEEPNETTEADEEDGPKMKRREGENRNRPEKRQQPRRALDAGQAGDPRPRPPRVPPSRASRGGFAGTRSYRPGPRNPSAHGCAGAPIRRSRRPALRTRRRKDACISSPRAGCGREREHEATSVSMSSSCSSITRSVPR